MGEERIEEEEKRRWWGREMRGPVRFVGPR